MASDKYLPCLEFASIKYGIGQAFAVRAFGDNALKLSRGASIASTMQKRSGSVFKGWEERFCMLVPTLLLVWFESPEATEPRGIVALTRDSIIEQLPSHEGKEHVLRIMARPTDRDGRILHIAAPDADTATQWTTHLYSDRPEVIQEEVRMTRTHAEESRRLAEDSERAVEAARSKERRVKEDATKALQETLVGLRRVTTALVAGMAVGGAVADEPLPTADDVATLGAALKAALAQATAAVAATTAEWEAQRRSATTAATAAGEKLAAAAAADAAAQATITTLRADLTAATKRGDDAVAALRKVVSDREALATGLTNAKEEWAAREGKYKEVLARLETQLRSEKERSAALSTSVATMRADLDRASEEARALRDVLKAKEGRIAVMLEEKAAADAAAAAARSASSHTIAQLQAQVRAAEAAASAASVARAVAVAAAAAAAASAPAPVPAPPPQPPAHAAAHADADSSAPAVPHDHGAPEVALPSSDDSAHAAPVGISPASTPGLGTPPSAKSAPQLTADRPRSGYSSIAPVLSNPDAFMSQLQRPVVVPLPTVPEAEPAPSPPPAGGTGGAATGAVRQASALVSSLLGSPHTSPGGDGSSGAGTAASGSGSGGTAPAGGGKRPSAIGSFLTGVMRTGSSLSSMATGGGAGPSGGASDAAAAGHGPADAGTRRGSGAPGLDHAPVLLPPDHDHDADGDGGFNALADPYPGRLWVFVMAARNLPEGAFGSFGGKTAFFRVRALNQPELSCHAVEVVDRGKGRGLLAAFEHVSQHRITTSLATGRVRLDVLTPRTMRSPVFLGGTTVDVSVLEEWPGQPHAVWLVLHPEEAKAAKVDVAEALIPVAANTGVTVGDRPDKLTIQHPSAGGGSGGHAPAAFDPLAATRYAMPELPPPPVDSAPCLLVQFAFTPRSDVRPRFHMPVAPTSGMGLETPGPHAGTHGPSPRDSAGGGSRVQPSPSPSAPGHTGGTGSGAGGGARASHSGVMGTPSRGTPTGGVLHTASPDITSGVAEGSADDDGHTAASGGRESRSSSVLTAGTGGAGDAATLAAALAEAQRKLERLAKAYKDLAREKGAREEEVARLSAEVKKLRLACAKLAKQLSAAGLSASLAGHAGGAEGEAGEV